MKLKKKNSVVNFKLMCVLWPRWRHCSSFVTGVYRNPWAVNLPCESSPYLQNWEARSQPYSVQLSRWVCSTKAPPTCKTKKLHLSLIVSNYQGQSTVRKVPLPAKLRSFISTLFCPTIKVSLQYESSPYLQNWEVPSQSYSVQLSIWFWKLVCCITV